MVELLTAITKGDSARSGCSPWRRARGIIGSAPSSGTGTWIARTRADAVTSRAPNQVPRLRDRIRVAMHQLPVAIFSSEEACLRRHGAEALPREGGSGTLHACFRWPWAQRRHRSRGGSRDRARAVQPRARRSDPVGRPPVLQLRLGCRSGTERDPDGVPRHRVGGHVVRRGDVVDPRLPGRLGDAGALRFRHR